MLFLQLAAGGHLLLFVVRTAPVDHRAALPLGAPLFLAIVATQVVAVLMCAYGILVPQLPWPAIGAVWLYVVAWMVVLDIGQADLRAHSGRPRTERRPSPATSRSRGDQAT